MKIRFASKVAAAAAAGLISAACGESMPEPETPAAEGAEATGDEAAAPAEATEGAAEGGEEQAACCKGMNECKAKGGCAVEGKHDCQGKNECKSQGGCNKHCPAQEG
jgi:hypothetical protein